MCSVKHKQHIKGDRQMGRTAEPIVIGTKYNFLTVVSVDGRDVHCRCDCGVETKLPFVRIKSGNTKSCGCYKSTNTRRVKHHGKGTVEYDAYNCMKQRCLSEKHRDFYLYGGRGISICHRWLFGEDGKHPFTCFLEDMGPRPGDGYSIGRRENDGNYEPSNCRWETPSEQIRNRSNSITVLFNGERIHIADAARLSGLKVRTIEARRQRGWPEERWLESL
jgi:hypothetical protein